LFPGTGFVRNEKNYLRLAISRTTKVLIRKTAMGKKTRIEVPEQHWEGKKSKNL
jgi:hypothetical protein